MDELTVEEINEQIYPDGTVIQIGRHRFALQAWEPENQLCESEVIYTGYTREEYDRCLEGGAIVVHSLNSDHWAWCPAGAYQSQFHDAGGIRIVGWWRDGKFQHLGFIWD